MSTEVQTKRDAHRQAQEHRRALETEQREIPGKLEYALSGGDVEEIQRLNRRKWRELPEAIQTASAIEHAAYSALVRAEQAEEMRLYEEAQEALDLAEGKLLQRRMEWAAEEKELVSEVDKWTIKRNTHEREHESWSTRFSQADARFREAVKQQEAA